MPGADAHGQGVTRGTPSQGGLPASEPGLRAGTRDLARDWQTGPYPVKPDRHGVLCVVTTIAVVGNPKPQSRTCSAAELVVERLTGDKPERKHQVLGAVGAPPVTTGDLVDILAVTPAAAEGAQGREPAFALVEQALVVGASVLLLLGTSFR